MPLYEDLEYNRNSPALQWPIKKHPLLGWSVESPFQHVTINATGNTVGERLVASVRDKSSFVNLFEKFIDYGQTNQWKWAGARASARGLLSQVHNYAVACDCGTFAAMLRVLAIEDPPYGLGLPALQVAVVSEYGTHHHGFVTHPTTFQRQGVDNTFMGNLVLNPFDSHRDGSSVFTEHHVVSFRGTLWDVTSSRCYNSLRDIVRYDIRDPYPGVNVAAQAEDPLNTANTVLVRNGGPDMLHAGRWQRFALDTDVD